MKEIKDLNKWRDTVFIRRLNTTRNSILPKLICIFNTLPQAGSHLVLAGAGVMMSHF